MNQCKNQIMRAALMITSTDAHLMTQLSDYKDNEWISERYFNPLATEFFFKYTVCTQFNDRRQKNGVAGSVVGSVFD
jgi:hypothetical protein